MRPRRKPQPQFAAPPPFFVIFGFILPLIFIFVTFLVAFVFREPLVLQQIFVVFPLVISFEQLQS